MAGQSSTDSWLVVANVVLATFTVVLAITYVVIAYLMRRTLEATRQIANTSADTAQRQLRAYVNVTQAVLTAKSERPEVFVRVKNTGQTPAYRVRHWITMGILKYAPDVVLPGPPPDLWQGNATVGAGVEIPLKIKRTDPVDPEELGTPDQTIYVFGEIRYFDAFGHERSTTYRMLYGGPKRVEGLQLHYDATGNEAT